MAAAGLTLQQVNGGGRDWAGALARHLSQPKAPMGQTLLASSPAAHPELLHAPVALVRLLLISPALLSCCVGWWNRHLARHPVMPVRVCQPVKRAARPCEEGERWRALDWC